MTEIPHSIATIESQHGLNEGNVGEVVKGVVVVLGNAIDYFLAGVHRLYIDACFSSDGWNILVACFLDANHRIQPVGSDWVSQNHMLIGTCSFASFTKLVFTPLLT